MQVNRSSHYDGSALKIMRRIETSDPVTSPSDSSRNQACNDDECHKYDQRYQRCDKMWSTVIFEIHARRELHWNVRHCDKC